MKKKKLISLLLATTMTATLFAGCGADDSEKQSGSKEENVEKEETAGQDELVYWSMWEEAEAQGQVIKQAVEKFNETSDVKLVVEFKGRAGIRDGLEPALEAGKHIDLFDEFEQSVNTIWAKYCYELDDLVEETGYAEAANPAMLDSFRELAGGKLVSIPYQPFVQAFFYNQSIFEEAGVKEVPKTWDEFLDTCEKIKKAGYIPLTTDDAYALWAFGTHVGRLIGDEKVIDMVNNKKWDEPGLLKAAQDYQELAEKGYFSENIESNVFPAGQNTEFGLGEVAMYFDGSWVPNEVKDITGDDFKWGTFAYPAVDDGVNGPETINFAAQAMAINKDCKHPEEAFQFIQLLTQGEFDSILAKESLGIPASVKTEEWPEQLSEVKDIMDHATGKIAGAGGIEYNMDVIPALKENVLKLCGGSITAEEFIANMSK